MQFEPEEILVEKVQSGEYHWKEYIYHHSRELIRDYEQYCDENRIDKSAEASAAQFIEMLDEKFNEALDNGEA
jgi:hypothetical protein